MKIKKIGSIEKKEIKKILKELYNTTIKMATKEQWKNVFLNTIINYAQTELNIVTETGGDGGSGGGGTGGGGTGGGGTGYTQGANMKIADWYDSETQVHLDILIYYIDGGWWPLRKVNSAIEIKPSGANIVSELNSKISNLSIPDGITIAAPDTDLFGLYSPGNFPVASFLQIADYYKWENDTFVLKNSGGGDTGIVPGSSRMGVDIVLISWDGLEGHDFNSDNPNTPPNGVDEGAWKLQNNRRTRERAGICQYKNTMDRLIPWYGKKHSPVTVPIYYGENYNGSAWTFNTHYVNVDYSFDYGETEMSQEIAYCNNAGVAALCFCYYPNDASYANKRTLFENNQNKGNLKMMVYVEPVSDQGNINYIVDKMRESYWYKVDGKPVLILQEGNASTQTAAYQAAFNSRGGTGAIYFILLSSGYASSVPEPFSANCIYTQFNGGNDGFRSYIASAQRSKKVIANITTGLQNLGTRIGVPGETAGYANHRATLEEVQDRFADLYDWMGETRPSGTGINRDDSPFVLGYAGNEVCESGRPILPTKNATTGNIEKELLDTVEYYFKKSV